MTLSNINYVLTLIFPLLDTHDN